MVASGAGTREMDSVHKASKRAAVWGLAALLLGAPLAAETAEERGDEACRRRAAGFLDEGAPRAEPIETAVAAYEEALESSPDDLGLTLKLIDALYFQGYYVIDDKKTRRRIV